MKSESRYSYLAWMHEMCCRLSIVLMRQNARALLPPTPDLVCVCVGGGGGGGGVVHALVVKMCHKLSADILTCCIKFRQESRCRCTSSSHIPNNVPVPSHVRRHIHAPSMRPYKYTVD